MTHVLRGLGREEMFSVSWDSPVHPAPLRHDTIEANYASHPLANITNPSWGRALATARQPSHRVKLERVLTPGCDESHVSRWDCEGVGDGVTHLPADTKISYY